MLAPRVSLSKLTPIGYSNNSCGYCKVGYESYSYYATAIDITVEFYQKLLDRGWRRSGTLLYKPDQRASCCPQYTTRLDSFAYRPSKDQRQTLNRFHKYIVGQNYLRAAARLYPKSREQVLRRKQEFDVVERIHESEKELLRSPPEPEHAFTVTIESNDFTEEKYLLFENYQRIVHHEPPDKISRDIFKEFLCESPLRKGSLDSKRNLGSFHQCYRINGKLIAIGVIDLLPQCVSSVYFMYDESVHDLCFGKISAMREIALAKELGYRWWYPGFYVHNCIKMKYKGNYSPQYILDPETYQWNLLTNDVKSQLDVSKYLSLSRQEEEAKEKILVSLQTSHNTDVDEKSITHESKDGDSSDLSTDHDEDEKSVTLDNNDGDSKDLSTDHNEDKKSVTLENNDGDSKGLSTDHNEDDKYYDDEDYGDVYFDDYDDELDSGVPIFLRNMPGVLTRDQLVSSVDLDNINIQVGDTISGANSLSDWETRSIDNCFSMKGIIASFAAVIGPELSREVLIKV